MGSKGAIFPLRPALRDFGGTGRTRRCGKTAPSACPPKLREGGRGRPTEKMPTVHGKGGSPKTAWESERSALPSPRVTTCCNLLGVPHPGPVVSDTGYSAYRLKGAPTLIDGACWWYGVVIVGFNGLKPFLPRYQVMLCSPTTLPSVSWMMLMKPCSPMAKRGRRMAPPAVTIRAMTASSSPSTFR
jgi:hypothetical protein